MTPAVKEYVFPGHPDKQCDIVADALVDWVHREDGFAKARCAFEVSWKGMLLSVGGEASRIPPHGIVKKAAAFAMHAANPVKFPLSATMATAGSIVTSVNVSQQSTFIVAHRRQGWGDQSVVVARAEGSAYRHEELLDRHFEILWQALRSDLAFTGDGKALFWVSDHGEVRGTVSASGGILPERLARRLRHAGSGMTATINPPDGSCWEGGPKNDCGMTNRKIVCDQHGLFVPCGGGGLSGKDYTKPDRGGWFLAKSIADEMARLHGSPATVVLGFEMGCEKPIFGYCNDRDFGPAAMAELPTVADVLAEREERWKAGFEFVNEAHPRCIEESFLTFLADSGGR